MNPFSSAIITPSYAPDFERCRLLSWSIEQFVTPSATHYIIVPAKDLPLFSQLRKPNTEIVTVESILPWWVQRLPIVKNGWLNFKTGFVRNWLLQQVVKLAVPQQVSEDILVYIDSDVTFIRPMDLESFVDGDRVRLLHIPNQLTPEFAAEFPIQDKWLNATDQLLGLPATPLPKPGYVGQVITWRRDNALKLHRHLEKVSGRGWVEAVCNSWHLSEYLLYGTFVDQVLQQQSGHFYDTEGICYEYWGDQTLSDQQLQKFLSEMPSRAKAIMISAKADIPPGRYETFVKSSQTYGFRSS